eukprot:gene1672-3231_t
MRDELVDTLKSFLTPVENLATNEGRLEVSLVALEALLEEKNISFKNIWHIFDEALDTRCYSNLVLLPFLTRLIYKKDDYSYAISTILKFEKQIGEFFNQELFPIMSWLRSNEWKVSARAIIIKHLNDFFNLSTSLIFWRRRLSLPTNSHILFFFMMIKETLDDSKRSRTGVITTYLNRVRNNSEIHKHPCPLPLLSITCQVSLINDWELNWSEVLSSFAQLCCDWEVQTTNYNRLIFSLTFDERTVSACDAIRQIFLNDDVLKIFLHKPSKLHEMVNTTLEMFVLRFAYIDSLQVCLERIIDAFRIIYEKFSQYISTDPLKSPLLIIFPDLFLQLIRRLMRSNSQSFPAGKIWTTLEALSNRVGDGMGAEMKHIFGQTIIGELHTSKDVLPLHAPVKFIKSLPFTKDKSNRSILLRYFTECGKKLLINCNKGIKSSDTGVNDLSHFLDEIFIECHLNNNNNNNNRSNHASTNNDADNTSPQWMMLYMEPITAILQGISQQWMSRGEKRHLTTKSISSLVMAISVVMSIILSTKKYCALIREEEWWEDFRILFRDRIIGSLPLFASLVNEMDNLLLDTGCMNYLAAEEKKHISDNIYTSSTSSTTTTTGNTERGGDNPQLPEMYVATTSAFGEVLFRVMSTIEERSYRNYNNNLKEVQNVLIGRCFDIMPSKDRDKDSDKDKENRLLCSLSTSFCAAGVMHTLIYLRQNQFLPPADLARFPAVIDVLLHPPSVHDFFLKSYVDQIHGLFKVVESSLLTALVAFEEERVTVRELEQLITRPDYMRSYEVIVRAFQLDSTSATKIEHANVEKLQLKFIDNVGEMERLHNIKSFLAVRNLFNEKNTVTAGKPQDSTNMRLNEIIDSNNSFKAALGLPEETLSALMTFAGVSFMFASRFDEGDKTTAFRNNREEICYRCKKALSRLEQLVNGEQIRISDFKLNLSNVLEELQQRRRATVASEMTRIAAFFAKDDSKHGKGSQVLDLNLDRLNSTMTLLRYKDELPACKVAITELELVPKAVRDVMEESVGLNQMMEDFYLADAPSILALVQQDLHGLSPWHLALIGKLHESVLLLSFLRRQGEALENGTLDRAQNRASTNEHASKVLMKLLPLRDLLRPFYSRSFTDLLGIRSHLEKHMGSSSQSSSSNNSNSISDPNDEPTILSELLNVAENWSVVEIYFRDGGESSRGADDVERLVEQYLATGRYISTLDANPESANLSFSYKVKGGTGSRISLAPDLLQEQVQCAVLALSTSSNRQALEEFVECYDRAQRAHAVRLSLEAAGHPSHQCSVSKTFCLSESASSTGLELATQRLELQLQMWKKQVSIAHVECPRLLLLNHRARLHFVLACSQRNGQSFDRSLPYVIQCFPTLLLQRTMVMKALNDALKSLNISSTESKESRSSLSTSSLSMSKSNDLDFAVQLLKKMESILAEKAENNIQILPVIEEGNNNEERAARLDLRGASPKELYCEHLADMISTGYCPGQPGMVIWGNSSVRDDDIRDALAVAAVEGLVNVVHVVGVDRLIASVREVLLCGLQEATLRCPLLLVFGEQEGSESFGQFDVAEARGEKSWSNLVKSFWTNTSTVVPVVPAAVPDTALHKQVEAWVVGGAAGMGKSRWIRDHFTRHNSKTSSFIRCVVHEGFSAAIVIQRYLEATKSTSPVSKGERQILAFHFDVTLYCNFDVLQHFLHHLFALGLLIDERTGEAAAILPDIDVRIYIELPSVSTSTSAGLSSRLDGGVVWPHNPSEVTTAQHPYMRDHLPVLAVAVAADHFIGITPATPYVLDEESRVTIIYILLMEREKDNFGTQPFPLHSDPNISDHDMLRHLNQFFQTYHVSDSKRVRFHTIRLLYNKILYLRKIQAEVQREITQQMQSHLSARFFGVDPSNPVVGAYRRVFQLFIQESIAIANDATVLPEVTVFTVRPPQPTDFEVIVTTRNSGARGYNDLCKSFMNAKKLDLSWGKVPPELRAQVAPAFGMPDTADFLISLRDCGHLLTPDSLVRILHMHGRRSLGASVIYEGETGVGKSQNLHLYSFLINKDSDLFTNLKLHLVAVLRTIAKSKLTDNRFLNDGSNSGIELAELSIGASTEDAIQAAMAWIKEDPLPLANELGAALCAYFSKLFRSYPLHREGLSPAAVAILERCQVLFDSQQEIAGASNMIALAAEMETYLPSSSRWEIPGNDTASAAGGGGIVDMTQEYEYDDDGNIIIPENLHTPSSMDYQSHAENVNDIEDDDEDDSDNEWEDEEEEKEKEKEDKCAGKKIASPFSQADYQELFKSVNDIREFMYQLVSAPPSALYHRLLADEGLSPTKWRTFLRDVSDAAQRLVKISPSAVVCVFVDELNTAGCLGMVCEAFTSHSLDGVSLPENIFFVGAINPLRAGSMKSLPLMMDFTRSHLGEGSKGRRGSKGGNGGDDNNDGDSEANFDEDSYLSTTPYIVKALPPSMLKLRLLYPSIGATPNGEYAFLEEYFRQHISLKGVRGESDPDVWEVYSFEFFKLAIRVIARAQSLVTSYKIPRVFMSIRNLVRVTKIIQWLLNNQVATARDGQGNPVQFCNIFLPMKSPYQIYASEEYNYLKQVLVIAIAVTYLFQLPSAGHVTSHNAVEDYRCRFLRELALEWAECEDSGRTCEEIEFEMKSTIADSFDHLWSYARIPNGIAPTTALKENFFAVVLSVSIPIPLLITGPPGCGKTLSFVLASDNLKGANFTQTVAFQHLKKVHKFPYQCSAESNGPEIACLYRRALEQQEVLDEHQPGRHICVVAMDEAGLPVERRQALKALHDVLEKPVVGTVMMSNTTLDAAKTSRTIQLLQTQANFDDLFELCNGLLTHGNSDDSLHPAEQHSRDVVMIGLCNAFQTIGEVVNVDNWFHSRDFVFLCRFLRHIIDTEYKGIPPAGLLTVPMLLFALRRHFQHVDPSVFPKIVHHFMENCNFEITTGHSNHDNDYGSDTLESLKSSLTDSVANHTDPTSAHCRYTLVTDPTDSEIAVDLMFALKLLDQTTTRVVSVSDFAEDCTPTRRTAVLAQIKDAIESGNTLLLVNSAPIHSALYDVINRHYAISINEEGEKVAYASIALGSFSRYVRVHPSFRLVMHIPVSQLGNTPLPLLNRMEKFTLSIKDALSQRLHEVALNPPLCLRSIGSYENRIKLFEALHDGVSDFVRFTGGYGTFYGIVPNETIPALILRAIEDACVNGSVDFEISGSSVSLTLKTTMPRKSRRVQNISEGVEETKGDMDEDDEEEESEAAGGDGDGDDDMPMELPSGEEMQSMGYEYSSSVDEMNAPASARLRTHIRNLNFQVIEMARVEAMFRLRDRLPALYIREYVDVQEHFTVRSYFSRLLRARRERNSHFKTVVYTRTDVSVLRLGTDAAYASQTILSSLRGDEAKEYRVDIKKNDNTSTTATSIASPSPINDTIQSTIWILPLAGYTSSQTFAIALHSCLLKPNVVILIADMKRCLPSQITFARHVVDEVIALETNKQSYMDKLPSVIFLVHIPTEQLHLKVSYQMLPIQGWTSTYVDAFSDGISDSTSAATPNGDSDGDGTRSTEWMKVAFGLTELPSVTDCIREFQGVAASALNKAIYSCKFKIQRSSAFFRTLRLQGSLTAYQQGNINSVLDALQERQYLTRTIVEIFTSMWGKMLIGNVSDACHRVSNGLTSRGLMECVRATHVWLLSDFMRVIVRRDLSNNWSLEALYALPRDESIDLHTEGEGVAISTNDSVNRALLAISILRSLEDSSHNQNQNDATGNSSSSRPYITDQVDCSRADWAPSTPLYYTLMRCLNEVVEAGMRVARIGDMFHRSQLESDEISIYGILKGKKCDHSLGKAVRIIENDALSWNRWVMDFIAIDLGLSKHKTVEANLLQLQLEHIVRIEGLYLDTAGGSSGDVDIGCAGTESDKVASTSSWKPKHVVRCVLLQQKLRSALSSSSRLLTCIRTLLQEKDFFQLSDKLQQQSDGTLGRSSYEDKNENDNENAVVIAFEWMKIVLEAVIDKLWDVLIEAAQGNFTEISSQESWKTWIMCMRDLIHNGFTDDIYLNGLTEQYTNRQFVMLLVFKCFGLCPEHCRSDVLSSIGTYLATYSVADKSKLTNSFLVFVILYVYNIANNLQWFDSFVIEVLRKVINSPATLSDPTCRLLVAGLLGTNLDFFRGMSTTPLPSLLVDAMESLGPEHVNTLLTMVFPRLSMTTRSEFLKTLMVINRNRMDEITNQLVTMSLDVTTSSTSTSDHVYLPSSVSASVTAFAQKNIFKIQNIAIKNNKIMKFNDESHLLLFQISLMFSNSDGNTTKKLSNIENTLEQFHNQRTMNRNRFTVLGVIKQSAYALLFLDTCAAFLSRQTDATNELGRDTLKTLREIIADESVSWSTYFLSRINSFDIISKILINKPLLDSLNIPWWFVQGANEQEAKVSAEGADALRRHQLDLHSRLTAIRFAQISIDFIQQKENLIPFGLSTLVYGSAPVDNNDPLLSCAADVVRYLVNPDICTNLACNRHIPVIIAMFQFVLEAFAFRYTEEEVQGILVDDAIDNLPFDERVRGWHIFREFLKSWEALRQVFNTFEQCRREVVAAASIPQITDKRGQHPMKLEYFIEFSSSEVNESGPARMLESRLMKHTSDVLNNPMVVQLRSDDDFNRDEWMLTRLVDSCYLDEIPYSSMDTMLLTGCQDSKATTASFESVLASYTSWTFTQGMPDLPVDRDLAQTNNTVDIRALFEQAADAAARTNQTLAHQANVVICPQCNQLGIRVDGCDVLKCGGTDSPYSGQVRGCGAHMSATTNRVPMPVPGTPVHPLYRPAVVEIPSNLLQLPPLPAITPSEGHYDFDWISLARCLLSTVIAGRVELISKYKNMNFFRPLPLRVVRQQSPTNLYQLNESNAVTQVAVAGSVSKATSTSVSSSLPLALSKSKPALGSVFDRLQTASEHLKSVIESLIKNNLSHNYSYKEILTEIEFKKVHSIAMRLEETDLEAQAEQLLQLCCVAIDKLQDNTRQDNAELNSTISTMMILSSSSSHNNKSVDHAAVMWSVQLRKSIGTISLKKLPVVIDVILQQESDGFCSKWPSLSVPLGEADASKLAHLFDTLVQGFHNDSRNRKELDNIIRSQLQRLGSLLMDNLEMLLAANTNTKLAVVEFVANALSSEGSESILRKITLMNSLRVKHVGLLLRHIRQTIGKMSQTEISHTIPVPASTTANANANANTLSVSDTKESITSGSVAVGGDVCGGVGVGIYRELVPEQWEVLQYVSTSSNAHPEETMSAAELLAHNNNNTRNRNSRDNNRRGDVDVDNNNNRNDDGNEVMKVDDMWQLLLTTPEMKGDVAVSESTEPSASVKLADMRRQRLLTLLHPITDMREKTSISTSSSTSTSTSTTHVETDVIEMMSSPMEAMKSSRNRVLLPPSPPSLSHIHSNNNKIPIKSSLNNNNNNNNSTGSVKRKHNDDENVQTAVEEEEVGEGYVDLSQSQMSDTSDSSRGQERESSRTMSTDENIQTLSSLSSMRWMTIEDFATQSDMTVADLEYLISLNIFPKKAKQTKFGMRLPSTLLSLLSSLIEDNFYDMSYLSSVQNISVDDVLDELRAKELNPILVSGRPEIFCIQNNATVKAVSVSSSVDSSDDLSHLFHPTASTLLDVRSIEEVRTILNESLTPLDEIQFQLSASREQILTELEGTEFRVIAIANNLFVMRNDTNAVMKYLIDEEEDDEEMPLE